MSKEQTVDQASAAHHFPEVVVTTFEWVQTAADLISLVAISGGFIVAALMWLRGEFTSTGSDERWGMMRDVRCFLGNYILLSLEFMIVSDLIHSFLNPDLESLTELGILVAIRTAISFFLGREMEMVAAESKASSSDNSS